MFKMWKSLSFHEQSMLLLAYTMYLQACVIVFCLHICIFIKNVIKWKMEGEIDNAMCNGLMM